MGKITDKINTHVCPDCNGSLIVKECMFHWRGKFLSGLVCEKCNTLRDNPIDSFIEYVKKNPKFQNIK